MLIDDRAALSCLTLAAACDGAAVRTLEGGGELLGRLQQAFTQSDAFQCGFCTPGQLMSAVALLERDPAPTREAVRDRHEREPLPLRRVREHRGGRPGRGRRRRLMPLAGQDRGGDRGVASRSAGCWSTTTIRRSGEQDERPPVIGREATRITARARVTGTARYTSDVNLPGMLEARVLRSPHANARLVSIDLDAARAIPGCGA